MFIEHNNNEQVCAPVLENSADLLISYFKQLGIDRVFGIPGGALEPFLMPCGVIPSL